MLHSLSGIENLAQVEFLMVPLSIILRVSLLWLELYIYCKKQCTDILSLWKEVSLFLCWHRSSWCEFFH